MSELILEVVEGPDAGRQITLDRAIEIGRAAEAGLSLNDDEVSRRHARISPENGGAVVEDLGSANGTFINQNELSGSARARVVPGDELVIGVSVLKVRSAEEVRAQPSAVRAVPPALAMAPREPTYVAPVQAAGEVGVPELDRLLDSRTKGHAKAAPFAIFALAVLVVLIFLATQ